LAVDYIGSFLNRLTREETEQHYHRYVGPYLTPDGQVDLDIAQQAINTVATELAIAPVTAGEVYLPSQSAPQQVLNRPKGATHGGSIAFLHGSVRASVLPGNEDPRRATFPPSVARRALGERHRKPVKCHSV
jgi:hypothetical protein